jgi:hypothetical protein
MTTKFIPYSEAAWKQLSTHQTVCFQPLKHNLRIASASNDTGPVVRMFFVRIDDKYLIVDTVVNPKASKDEVTLAGNLINQLLVKQAQVESVLQLLMLSNGGDCTVIDTYPLYVPQREELPRIKHVSYAN